MKRLARNPTALGFGCAPLSEPHFRQALSWPDEAIKRHFLTEA